jgi:hypothetical protein
MPPRPAKKRIWENFWECLEATRTDTLVSNALILALAACFITVVVLVGFAPDGQSMIIFAADIVVKAVTIVVKDGMIGAFIVIKDGMIGAFMVIFRAITSVVKIAYETFSLENLLRLIFAALFLDALPLDC